MTYQHGCLLLGEVLEGKAVESGLNTMEAATDQFRATLDSGAVI
jgi:hypothetical protein